MTMTQVQTELSTPEGFAARVQIPRKAVSAARTLLILSGLGIAYNLFSTLRTLGKNPGAAFFDIFLSTYGDNPLSSLWFTILVWGPIIMLPLAIIFFAYSRSSAQRVAESTYRDYRTNGYLVPQRAIGLTVPVRSGNSTTQVPATLVGHPAVSEAKYEEALRSLAGYVASLDPKTTKGVAKSLAAGLSPHGVPASTLVATVPTELTLSAPVGKGDWIVVVPPSTEGAKARVLGLKS